MSDPGSGEAHEQGAAADGRRRPPLDAWSYAAGAGGDDSVGVLESFAAFGIECVVIGDCAVGAYARLVGERVFSADLDLLVTRRSLEMVLADSDAFGVWVEKRPQPRTVPLAVLEWQGREVNLLTGTTGLPPADVVARGAREFHIGGGADRAILIADPFDLLRNKLAVNRAKDRPHIAVLRRFLAEEAVAAFSNEDEPRARIAVAERLLEVHGAQALDDVAVSREHRVRLSGEVDSAWHKRRAEEVARAVKGVEQVSNALVVAPPLAHPGAFEENVRATRVQLLGTVDAPFEKERAAQVAYRIPGVDDVINAIQIRSARP